MTYFMLQHILPDVFNMSVSGLGMLINKARFLPINITVFSADYRNQNLSYDYRHEINQCTRITEVTVYQKRN